MWLRRILKNSNYGTGWSPSGGGGSDGMGSDNALGLGDSDGQHSIIDENIKEKPKIRRKRKLKRKRTNVFY